MGALGDQFLGMFAEIENCMKLELGKRQNVRFIDLAREYVQVHNLPSSYLVSLQTYAALRNAIDHNSHRGAYPIAEPIPEIVEEIRRLRDKIKAPPEAIAVLPEMNVYSVHSGEPVSVALEYVRQFDFSQLPVYESGQYVGVLTTNTIARWLAQQIVDGREHRDAAVSEVMEFREPSDCALLMDRTLTAADAIHQLACGGSDGGPVNALILTQNMLPTDRPIRVIAVYDVPLLSAALKFG
ncbi:MAG: CBS domain-containing protein [Streptosporangiaceae bacterium]